MVASSCSCLSECLANLLSDKDKHRVGLWLLRSSAVPPFCTLPHLDLLPQLITRFIVVKQIPGKATTSGLIFCFIAC